MKKEITQIFKNNIVNGSESMKTNIENFIASYITIHLHNFNNEQKSLLFDKFGPFYETSIKNNMFLIFVDLYDDALGQNFKSLVDFSNEPLIDYLKISSLGQPKIQLTKDERLFVSFYKRFMFECLGLIRNHF